MNKENPVCVMRAATALACSHWAPIIPVRGTAAECHDTNTTILHDVSPDNGAGREQTGASGDFEI